MDTKAAILDHAARQLRRGGYGELNFSSIAKALDTTRANIHHHFDNKENLARAAIAAYMAETQAKVEAAARACDCDFPKFIALLEDMLWAHFEETGGEGVCVCGPLLVNSDRVPLSLREMSSEFFVRYIERFAQLIRVWQEKQDVVVKYEPEALAKEAVVLLQGFMHMARSMVVEGGQTHPLKGFLKRWAAALE